MMVYNNGEEGKNCAAHTGYGMIPSYRLAGYHFGWLFWIVGFLVLASTHD